MTRDDVLSLIRAHLADELQLDPGRGCRRTTRFKEDLEADSLDLYTPGAGARGLLRRDDVGRAGGAHHDRGAGGRLRARARAAGGDGPRQGVGPRAEALSAARVTRPARAAAGRPRPAGGHARLVDGPSRGVLRAPRLPRRLGARPGRHHGAVPAARRGGLRRRPADQGPRAGGLGSLLPCGRRAARAAGAPAHRGAAGRARRPRWRRSSRRSACSPR